MSALEIADIIGIISFALSGFLIAVHCKLDILGVFISAFLTAFGGGMTRDVLADRTPYVFTSNLPLSLVIAKDDRPIASDITNAHLPSRFVIL